MPERSTPKRLICLLAAATASIAALPARAEPVTLQRPNILLLLAEDMSSRVGAYGDAVAKTPSLDGLAAEGIRYTQVFTTAGVCAPSRASLITGFHAISIGAHHMRTSSAPSGGYKTVPPPAVKAFPEILRRAGYFTFTDMKLDYQFSGAMTDGPFTIWDETGLGPTWRDRDDPAQPFFGLRNFQVTHESGLFRPLFEGCPHSVTHFVMALSRLFMGGLGSVYSPTAPESVVLPPYYPDTPVVRKDVARHYDNIQRMDAEVGALLSLLDEDGLAESTIVIWSTDHGDGLPRAKRELYDSGLRVPMIIRWPERFRPEGVEPGSVDHRLISFVDLAPTILKLAGVPRPEGLQGVDFASPDGPGREYAFASRDRIDEFVDRERAVTDGRFKYIRSWYPESPTGHSSAFRDNIEMMRELWALHAAGALDPVQQLWFEPTGEERLYDTRSDPHEIRNLVNDPASAATLSRMRAAYARWSERVEDWAEIPEAEMVAQMWPDGRAPVTAPPRIERTDAGIVLHPQTEGASLAYQLDATPWRLYTDPITAPSGTRITTRAIRYGYKESQAIQLTIP